MVDFFSFDILKVYVSVMAVIAIIIIFLIVWNRSKLQKQEIYKVLSVFWLVVFMLNTVPSLVYAINSNTKYIGDDKNYKTKFNVDTSLPSPNIYWLLMDGMLGFKAMEHLFNDPQAEFCAQLTERGFIINRDAQFEALHATAFSIPVLMSPHYYDTLYLPILRDTDLLNHKEKTSLRNSNREFGRLASLARMKNEFISAFNGKGYKTSVVAYAASFFYIIPDNIFIYKKQINIETIDVLDTMEKFRTIIDLINQMTPLGIFKLDIFFFLFWINMPGTDISGSSADIYESFFGNKYRGNDKWYYDALTAIMNHSEPKLVIIHDVKAHFPFEYDEYGTIERKGRGAMAHYYYPPQHYFTTKIVISYIDYILNLDSEAIIILQSDHGLHAEETRRQLISYYGKNNDDVRLMQNQTISAVRIPEKWGGLDQPIEPPNITRLLVNRYVGENYTLLSSDDIIK
jgi:hypothetical protein